MYEKLKTKKKYNPEKTRNNSKFSPNDYILKKLENPKFGDEYVIYHNKKIIFAGLYDDTLKKFDELTNNKSKSIQHGIAVRSRDGKFYKGKDKEKYKNNLNIKYRKLIIVETNQLDEIMVEKLHGIFDENGKLKKNVKQLKSYQSGYSGYKGYTEILDKNRDPLKLDNDFQILNDYENLSSSELKEIKKFAFKDADKYIVNDNIKKLNWLKNRK